MSRPKPGEVEFSSRAWPVHVPPAGFADLVLDRAARARTGMMVFTTARSVSSRQRWSWPIAVAVLGIGVTAAAYRFVGGATNPEPVAADVTPIAEPRFTPVPIALAIDTAVCEPERTLTVARKPPAAISPPGSTASPAEEVPPVVLHYPPCHCGPGAVVCSCVE